MSEQSVHIATLFFELHLPASGSLKSKRMILKSLKDRIRARFNVAVAEIGHWDKWQRALLGVCAIGSEKKVLESSLQKVLSLVEATSEIHVTQNRIEFS